MVKREYTVTVIGDLNVEVSANLDNVRFSDIGEDLLSYAPVHLAIGGTATNFAEAAIDRFAIVNVVGVIGDDLFGKFIVQRLQHKGIRIFCNRVSDSRTGTAIYLRDSTQHVTKGVRLLVIEPGANTKLMELDIERHEDALAASNLLLLDGYCFLRNPRRSTSFYVMKYMKDHGVTIALDIVPHHAHTFFSQEFFQKMMENVDVAIAEVRTIRRLIGLKAEDEVLDDTVAFDTWREIQRLWPQTVFFLRFGAGNISQSMLCYPGNEPLVKNTGYSQDSNPRGFGDRLSANELFDHLSKMAIS